MIERTVPAGEDPRASETTQDDALILRLVAAAVRDGWATPDDLVARPTESGDVEWRPADELIADVVTALNGDGAWPVSDVSTRPAGEDPWVDELADALDGARSLHAGRQQSKRFARDLLARLDALRVPARSAEDSCVRPDFLCDTPDCTAHGLPSARSAEDVERGRELAAAFLDGLWASNDDIDDDEAAHLWRIRQRDVADRPAGSEALDLARRIAELPPATTPAGWPPWIATPSGEATSGGEEA